MHLIGNRACGKEARIVNRSISMSCDGGRLPIWEESPKSQAGVHYPFPTAVGNSGKLSRLSVSLGGLLVGQQVVGPLLISDHVVGVVGRRVLGRTVGAYAGRHGGNRPVD